MIVAFVVSRNVPGKKNLVEMAYRDIVYKRTGRDVHVLASSSDVVVRFLSHRYETLKRFFPEAERLVFVRKGGPARGLLREAGIEESMDASDVGIPAIVYLNHLYGGKEPPCAYHGMNNERRRCALRFANLMFRFIRDNKEMIEKNLKKKKKNVELLPLPPAAEFTRETYDEFLAKNSESDRILESVG